MVEGDRRYGIDCVLFQVWRSSFGSRTRVQSASVFGRVVPTTLLVWRFRMTKKPK
jgi:hypothetical protein